MAVIAARQANHRKRNQRDTFGNAVLQHLEKAGIEPADMREHRL
jgi:hypothetical protein